MKFATLIILLAFTLSAFAQDVQPAPTQAEKLEQALPIKEEPTVTTIEYKILKMSADSFYLVEKVSSGKGKERPAVTETPILFRSFDQLLNYATYLKNQAVTYRKQAGEIKEKAKEDAVKSIETANEQSRKLLEAAPQLEAIGNKVEAVAQENRALLTGKDPVPTKPTKPKPKKKKKA